MPAFVDKSLLLPIACGKAFYVGWGAKTKTMVRYGTYSMWQSVLGGVGCKNQNNGTVSNLQHVAKRSVLRAV
jgi:hypothetical protein